MKAAIEGLNLDRPILRLNTDVYLMYKTSLREGFSGHGTSAASFVANRLNWSGASSNDAH